MRKHERSAKGKVVGMETDTCIKGAHILYHGEVLEGCIAISDGKIAFLGKEANAPRAERILDARGLLALPGPIDAHVHLRDEGLAYKEDFYSGTCSAVAGGITSVLDMPNNSPLVDSASRLAERARKARGTIVANVGFYSLLPADLNGLRAIAEAGAVAIKVFMHEPRTELPVWDEAMLLKAVSLANRLGLPVAFHAEDPGIIGEAKCKLRPGLDPVSKFVLSHPPEAEVEAVGKLARLLRGLRVHICHASVPRAVELAKGAGFTVEATPHHLFLSSDLYERLGPIALMDPPLRPRELVMALRALLYDGLIDIVASDHAPHALGEKLSTNHVPPGIPGLETMLPLLLNEVAEGRLSLQHLISLVCEGPARIFGLRAGRLEVGWPADLVLVDLRAKHVVKPDAFFSKAKFSPFEGLEFRGRPIGTIVNGQLAFWDGEVVARRGCGRILKPEGQSRGQGDEVPS